MKWSEEIIPVTNMKSIPESTRLKMRFSGEQYPEKERVKAGKGRKQSVVENPYKDFFEEYAGLPLKELPRSVEDVLVGVSRLNWYKSEGEQKPLSVKKMLYILGKFDEITRDKVGWLLGVKDRQAKRYVRAVKLALENLVRSEECVEVLSENSDDFFV